ncbi:MAG: hypothetical protein ACXADD_13845 [Candidatus Thorarchaeota archaeon]|jgi:hypothetical protein
MNEPKLGEVVRIYLRGSKVLNNRNRREVVTLNYVRFLEINQRLGVLEEAFNPREACIGTIGESVYNRYRKLTTYFIQLRGDIVHNNPAPSLRKYDHEFFESIRGDVRKFLIGFFDEMNSFPEPIRKQFGITWEWLEKLLPTFTIILSMPKMIVVFVAMLDAVIHSQME